MSGRFSPTVLNHRIHRALAAPFLRLLPATDILRLEKEVEMEIMRSSRPAAEGGRTGPDVLVISLNHRAYRALGPRLPFFAGRLSARAAEHMRGEGLMHTGGTVSVRFEACAYLGENDVSVAGSFSGTRKTAPREPAAGWYLYPEGKTAEGIFIDAPGEYHIGRAAGSAIAVTSPYVSSRHATIRMDGAEGIFISDSGSANGTFVNGRKIGPGERRPLERGDVISLGRRSGASLVVR